MERDKLLGQMGHHLMEYSNGMINNTTQGNSRMTILMVTASIIGLMVGYTREHGSTDLWKDKGTCTTKERNTQVVLYNIVGQFKNDKKEG